MGKIKNLLKKSTKIGASALLLVSTLLPSLALQGQLIVSATNASTTLAPGGAVDTGNHTWGLKDFQTANNYTPVGKNTSGAGWSSSSTYDFGTNQANTGSWLPFNGAVDMTQSIRIVGTTLANSKGLFGSGKILGDANGILLTNLSSSQLSEGATGGNLGVGNLGSGTYFIGNNYSYKKTSIIVGSDYNTATGIAQGNGPGAKILSASSDYTANNNSTNLFIMEWSNPVLNSDGTVTGTISYLSRNGGTNYVSSADITVQKSMSIGFMAATGGNYSQMSVTVNEVTAGKGVQPVNVNYLNSLTGSQLAPKGTAWKNSTITANVGDKIGVVAQGNTVQTSDNYDYFVPVAPTGYNFKSFTPAVTVQNFPVGTANPNQINVSYTPLAQSAGFTFNYDPAAQRTPTVPPLYSVSGVTDQTIVAASPNFQKNLAAQVPAGYYISKITNSAGGSSTGSTTDSTIKSFLAGNPTFDATVSKNQYQIMLSAANQTGTVNFAYKSNVPAGAPTLPNDIQLSGLTGSDLNFVMPNISAGYVVSSVVGPNNVTYSSIAEALQANNHFVPGSNNFKVTISAVTQNGTISYNWASNVPGQNGVVGKLQATLPATTAISGLVGETIKLSPDIPTGYGIDKVVAPDGKTYTDSTTPGMTALQAAQAANPKFIVGPNNFVITLKALEQDVTLKVNVDQNSGSGAPTAPQPYTIATLLTGAPIDGPSIDKAQKWLNDWITNNAAGWSVKDFLDPNLVSYVNSGLSSAVTGAGGVAFFKNNVYQVNLIYSGSIGFSSVPSQIDFGKNPVVPVDKSYQGMLDNSVVVSDTRAPNLATSWTVSVSQSSPIQEVINNGVDTPVSGGISFMNYLSYDGKVLTNNPQVVHSKSTGEVGDTVVIDKASPSLFALKVPSSFQKVNSEFKGTLSWTLTSAP